MNGRRCQESCEWRKQDSAYHPSPLTGRKPLLPYLYIHSAKPVAIRQASIKYPDGQPSARALTARQSRFVEEYLRNGGKQTRAAVDAGYAEGTAPDMGSRLVRLPHIQQAIMRETLQTIGLHAVPALKRVRELVDASKSDYVKLEAAKDLLDRAGYGVPPPTQRDDQTLSVNIHLGGSKTTNTDSGTHPDTGKARPELDGSPQPLAEVIEDGNSQEIFPSETDFGGESARALRLDGPKP